eukprot:CAMPEP_0201281502 /NCGR_PEP_ID=MMETSP1317-20130820/2997_1 /ASSEMBLY_ACC=CAM_ASM_000770 /TAXON_ID=187299 /ORGANISM="Undescribed Undescribed, Strain Undescribed" /LENGTH=66 /DNA_ID=CAMNT_0047591443 /DNA_START=413 /DNA_END=613 /DNA_ORIENTATION=+
MCMHLTNYAINKNSDKFVFNFSEHDDDVGHKRSLPACWEVLESQGANVPLLKDKIADIIIKTLCSI